MSDRKQTDFRCAAFPARTAGVVLHVSSLPGEGPIGSLGAGARAWIDFLAEAGFGWWQVCPLGPTGYGDSPYQPLSAFALNPYFIDLADLVEGGLLTADEVGAVARGGSVDYGHLWHGLRPLLDLAAERGAEQPERLARWGNLAEFRAHEGQWLRDWERFCARREANAFHSPETWNCDADDHRAERRAAILQLILAAQWGRLRTYAHKRGVRILGDEPIYVSADGCDRWAHPELFAKDAVAGVPPDYFSADGQLWGNPLYAWDRHVADDFAWWRTRIGADLQRFDAVRIDHFRGLCDYWAVPRDATTAREGAWRPGPGFAFFRALGDLPLVAEDLGELSPGVHTLRAEARLPGMSVLQFGFPLTADNPHHPDTITVDRVAYTGTHDNDTTVGWFSALDRPTETAVRNALGQGAIEECALRAVINAPAIAAFAPAQDLLGLGSEARLNTPGQPEGNWTWRMSDAQLRNLRLRSHEWLALLRAAGRT